MQWCNNMKRNYVKLGFAFSEMLFIFSLNVSLFLLNFFWDKFKELIIAI